MACRLGQAGLLNHITAGRREGTEKRKKKREIWGGGGGSEMKEQQMRDFPVRRINQQTMNSTAQSLTPRLDRSIAMPSTHTHTNSLLPSQQIHPSATTRVLLRHQKPTRTLKGGSSCGDDSVRITGNKSRGGNRRDREKKR